MFLGRALAFALLVSSFALASASRASAQSQVTMTTTRVASGLTLPLFVTAPTGDTSRIFILEQRVSTTGRIRILQIPGNTLLGTPYLSISPVATGNEEGLLGLAFHPDFANNGFFFVFYSLPTGNNTVVRYQANAPFTTSTTANAASATTVITIPHSSFSNHNGGWIGFGPDGYLYIASGDGGSEGDPSGNGQNINVLVGKMLRIDVNTLPYTSPPTNPFFGVAGADEIWHYGLRNPWRDSFDRATGDLLIGDVGQNAHEEIDFQPAGQGGLNFGWRCMEGFSCTGMSGCTCNSPALTLPVYDYPHTGGSCSITGGYVYRGSALCGVQGTYFFADYCSAQIWSFRLVGGSVTQFANRTAELAPGGGLSINSITSFGEDANGELYICDQGGEIFKVIPRMPATVDCNGNSQWDVCDIQNGTSSDANGDGIPDECQSVGTSFCFGDGTQTTPCPCNNSGLPGHGCNNSAATGGAQISATGTTSPDTVVLKSTGELPSALSIFLQGDTLTSAVFGDGVRCANGNLKRLYSKNAVGGVVSAPTGAERSITARSAALGDAIPPGATRHYQVYYRDPSSTFCPNPPGDTWNVSDGLHITW
jgi:glucose/arabinose dehydrogenase